MKVSSELLNNGIDPSKLSKTEKKNLNSDEMGFFGVEGVNEDYVEEEEN